MRIAMLIVATLALLVTSAVGFLGTYRGMTDAKAIDALLGDATEELGALSGSSSEAGELKHLADSTGGMRVGAAVFGVAGLAALVLLVLAFVNRGVPWAALALVVLALVGTFVSPHYDLGPFAPASARELGYVVTVAALLGAGGAVGAWMLKNRRARAAAPQVAPAPSRA
ncbi:MAG: hypothetical protein JXB32_00370 [Deltaproteobacteria bacterium]|nr:hypothetical protein [Deltaproteobacteria bacterium]